MIIKFSEKLKELRLEKELKQIDLAKVLNVTQSTITRWENNVQEPDYLILAKLAKYFGVTTDYLLGIED